MLTFKVTKFIFILSIPKKRRKTRKKWQKDRPSVFKACLTPKKNAVNDVIIGGAGPYYTNMTTVEFFDLATGKWINLPNLERGR
jgi:hypothetical protein